MAMDFSFNNDDAGIEEYFYIGLIQYLTNLSSFKGGKVHTNCKKSVMTIRIRSLSLEVHCRIALNPNEIIHEWIDAVCLCILSSQLRYTRRTPVPAFWDFNVSQNDGRKNQTSFKLLSMFLVDFYIL